MSRFSERDVRRCYDLLQHGPEIGLTQLKAIESGQIIGLGLFDNEDDFVAECSRYNALGNLYVGVNPRSPDLLDQFGGLKNRIRSVWTDIWVGAKISLITGVAVPEDVVLSEEATALHGEASVLFDRETFFALGRPVSAISAESVKTWFAGPGGRFDYSTDQDIRIPGTARMDGSLLTRRVVFRRYRPYQLNEISDGIVRGAEPQ